MAVRPQLEMFGGLFKAGVELAGAVHSCTNKAGGVRIGLLPMRSKIGDSLASISGFKGAALDAYRSRMNGLLKVEQCGMDGKFAASTDWKAGGIRFNKEGTLATVKWVYRPGTLSKEAVLATASAAELMAALEKKTAPAPTEV